MLSKKSRVHYCISAVIKTTLKIRQIMNENKEKIKLIALGDS